MSINQGVFDENIVAPAPNEHKLLFCVKYDSIEIDNHVKIDFLITKGNIMS